VGIEPYIQKQGSDPTVGPIRDWALLYFLEAALEELAGVFVAGIFLEDSVKGVSSFLVSFVFHVGPAEEIADFDVVIGHSQCPLQDGCCFAVRFILEIDSGQLDVNFRVFRRFFKERLKCISRIIVFLFVPISAAHLKIDLLV
jgi:hypothetical protein